MGPSQQLCPPSGSVHALYNFDSSYSKLSNLDGTFFNSHRSIRYVTLIHLG